MYDDNRGNKKPYRARGSRGGRRRKGSQATQTQKPYNKKQNPLCNYKSSYGLNEESQNIARVQSSSKLCKNPMIYDRKLYGGTRMSTYNAHEKFERNDYQQLSNYHYNNSELGRPLYCPPHSRPSPRKQSELYFKRGNASSMHENHDYSSLLQPPPLVESCSSFSSHSSSSGPHTTDYQSKEYDRYTSVNDHEVAFMTTKKQLNEVGVEGKQFYQQQPSVEAYEECWGSLFSTSPRSFLLGRNVENDH
mmetsp:Transcript_11181/g.14109  ORF Transcript_11181/g.14109 Transcript_11181/m.14109 type:complete len:248 (+) Transcript_11181:49-792(+)